MTELLSVKLQYLITVVLLKKTAIFLILLVLKKCISLLFPGDRQVGSSVLFHFTSL